VDEILVSVVIPTYNRVDRVVFAIDSVKRQSYPNIEMIVVDDGSTDDTRNVIENRFGDSVIYEYKENGGASSARNQGIARSSGKYVAFLDSDDRWADNKIEKQFDFMESHPDYGISLCEISVRDVDGKQLSVSAWANNLERDGWVFESFLQNMYITCSSMFIRRSVFDDVGLFDESLSTAEDKDLVLRISVRYKLYVIGEPLVQYYRSSDSLSNNVFTGNSIKALKKIVDYAPLLHRQHEALIKRLIAAMHCHYAEDLLFNKRYAEAREQLKQCAILNGITLMLFCKSFIYQLLGM